MDIVLVLLAVPFGAAAVLLSLRRPEWVLLTALALVAFEGSIEAFTGQHPYGLVHLMLGCFVLGRAGHLLLGRRDRRILILPWLIPAAAFVFLMAMSALTTEPIVIGWHGFKEATFFILVGLTAAITLTEERTRVTMVRGIILITAAVGTYASFRWVVGPAAAELAVASKPGRNFYVVDHVGLFGSFSGRDGLARWVAFTIPLCIAAATLLRTGWRWVALYAAAVAAVALLGSEVRSGAVAAGIGSLLVLVLQHTSRAKRGLALGTTIAAVVFSVGGAIAAYTVTIGSSAGSEERFGNILEREEDDAYSARIERWSEAMAIVEDHPFGLGLGTAGRASAANQYVILGTQNLDSSYLQVALELGFPGLTLLVLSIIFTLGGLAFTGWRTPDPERAVAAIGAAGALAAQAAMMYTSLAIGGMLAGLVWLMIGVACAGFATPPPLRRQAAVPAYVTGLPSTARGS